MMMIHTSLIIFCHWLYFHNKTNKQNEWTNKHITWHSFAHLYTQFIVCRYFVYKTFKNRNIWKITINLRGFIVNMSRLEMSIKITSPCSWQIFVLVFLCIFSFFIFYINYFVTLSIQFKFIINFLSKGHNIYTP